MVLTEQVRLQHLLTVDALEDAQIMYLIQRAQAFKDGAQALLADKQLFVANMFFENSTRTHKSFEIAEKRLGLEVIDFQTDTSSVQKGESLYDTVLTMSAIGAKALVIRHPEECFYQTLLQSPTLNCAIINGGDGSGQHPSQCLLDLLTIYETFQHFAGLKVAIVGDLRHSRVAKSNMQLLTRLGAQVYFSGPEAWYDASFEAYGQYVPLDEIVDQVDVMMLLRVQHERHQEKNAIADYHQRYGLTMARAERLQKHAIIMHPAPVNRGMEIDGALIEGESSRIVQQMTNGVYMRMAILETILQTVA